MSNAYSFLTTGNTFGDWIVTTNGLVFENNNFNANNYHKAAGTLFLDEGTTSLQANGIVIFQGFLHSTGASGAEVDYNLSVQGQTYLSNTTLALTANGQANLNGLVIAQAPGTSLFVANNANVQGNVAITGNTTIGNNLFVTSNTTSQNTYTLGTTVTLGTTYTSSLQSNVFVNTALLTVTGPAYVAFVQANNFVNTALVTITGNLYANNVQANTSVNTSLLSVTGNSYVTNNSFTNVLQSNTSVNTALMTITGNLYANNVQANTSVNTATITATGSITVGGSSSVGGSSTVGGSSLVVGSSITNSLQANNFVNTALITVTGNTYSGNLISNSALLVKGTSILTGTANTLADLGIGGNLNVPNLLFMGNSTSSANIYNLTVPSGGTLTVSGNFVQSFPLIYNATSFTLSASSPISSGNFATFNVFRTANANASIRWDETNKYWATLNVASNVYNQIVTSEQLSNSSTSSNTFNVATSLAVLTANTFLQANDATTLSSAQDYANTIVSANVVTLQSQIAANVVTVQSQIAANVITIQSQIAANLTSLSGSLNASSLSTGTIPSARFPTSGVSANVYGGSTQIPILTIDATGRVTTASNSAITTVLPLAGSTTTGTPSVNLLNQTLTITSGNISVITTNASSQSITINPTVSGVTAGSYGSTGVIPIITVDTFGRVQTLTTANVTSTINLTGTSGTGNVSGAPGTLTFTGNFGMTVSVSGNTANIATPQDLRTTAVPQFYNITTTTPLVVTSGGTGVTTSTGSGNNVLSISPTLTTPILGTPQSGNLSNCTNYGGSITSTQILSALGYTPYSATNPTGFITLAQAFANTSSQGFATQTYVTNQGFITSSALSSYATQTYVNSQGFASTSTSSWTPSGGTFNVTGAIVASGNITAFSDIRLKSNIVTITGALDLVNQMRGVTYEKDGKRNLGVIAQEVQKILPELVHEGVDENKTLSVAYGNISGVLIEAIKELTEQVKELKAEIETLKGNK